MESELPLPADESYPISDEADASRTLTIHLSPSGTLDAFSKAMPLAGGGVRSYDVGDGILLCAGSDLRLHIDREATVVTVAAAEKDQAAAGAYLVGPALSFCTLLRGEAPLHAAGAEIDGRRFGLLAPSGTGKSTTLWALLQDGALFANDDMIPVRFESKKAVATASGSLRPKVDAAMLARQSVALLSDVPLPEVLPGSGKYWYPLPPNRRATGDQPLAALFLLEPKERTSQAPITITPVRGGCAVSLLLRNLMAPVTTAALLGTTHLLQSATALAQVVPIYRVSYPKRLDLLPALSRAIRETLQ